MDAGINGWTLNWLEKLGSLRRAWKPVHGDGRVWIGAEGDRTLDLRIANATLSQLSYRPISRRAILASQSGGSNEVLAAPNRCGYHPQRRDTQASRTIGDHFMLPIGGR